MPSQATTQGECTECGESDGNYTVVEKSNDIGEEDSQTLTRELRCICGAEPTVRITGDGIETDGPISHEDASWNQDQ